MKDLQKQARKYFLKYKKLLGLPKFWHMKIVIKERLTEWANCEFDYSKKLFIININAKKHTNLKDLKDSILHELFHALLSPATTRIDVLLLKIRTKKYISYKTAKKQLFTIEEKLVKQLTNIILKAEKNEE